MVGLYPEGLQALLNLAAYFTAAAPQPNDDAWTKSACKDLYRQPERVQQQGLFIEILFFHAT